MQMVNEKPLERHWKRFETFDESVSHKWNIQQTLQTFMMVLRPNQCSFCMCVENKPEGRWRKETKYNPTALCLLCFGCFCCETNTRCHCHSYSHSSRSDFSTFYFISFSFLFFLFLSHFLLLLFLFFLFCLKFIFLLFLGFLIFFFFIFFSRFFS